MAEPNASRTIERLLDAWIKSQQRLQMLTEQIKQAREDQLSAEHELAESILPKDAELGEVFSIWVRTEHLGFPEKERILQAWRQGETRLAVQWRITPKKNET